MEAVIKAAEDKMIKSLAALNDEFNTTDLLQVFQAGKYENGEAAGWREGDWNGNGLFETGDLLRAFKDGGFEQSHRVDVVAVPEPASAILLLGSLIFIATRRRRFDP